jgi:histidinol-phosphate aminotransferase
LRFGYLMTAPVLAAEINKVKLPYNVNIFTLMAAEVLLGEREAVDGSIEALIDEREKMLRELARIPGVEPFPSQANFVLFRTARSAATLFEQLYADGILVRNVSHYPMLDRCLRVSVGTPDQNSRFLESLGRILGG